MTDLDRLEELLMTGGRLERDAAATIRQLREIVREAGEIIPELISMYDG